MSLIPNTQEKIEHQKWVADVMLQKVLPIDPYCIVAGGAPRDWHFGKVASDIDLFFYDGKSTVNALMSRFKAVDIEIESSSFGYDIPEWYKLNPLLIGVYNLTYQGVKVQLLRMKEPTFRSVLPNFPLSICHAWYKSGKIRLEKPFIRSEKFKSIYKTAEIYNDEHAYVQKILAKFPDWKYYQNIEALSAQLLDN